MRVSTLPLFLALAIVVPGCSSAGSTPSAPATGIDAGFMRITVRVAGRLDFSNYRYLVVLNTSGNGLTPHFGRNAGWSAYSASLQAANEAGSPLAQIDRYVSGGPHVPPAIVAVEATPNELQFEPNSGGAGKTLSFTFERSLLDADGAQTASDWRFNVAVLKSDDVEGYLGACASCFKSPALPVGEAFDTTIAGSSESAPGPARIASVELENRP
ncbi:MAG TPA: hypothetical protein VGF18_06725 [Candidatus Tumulicola sp.]|jgi:hypothetical protein